MGILYFKPDGTILCHLPGEERDPIFERQLVRGDIPFIVHSHRQLAEAPPLDRGADGMGPVAHVRTTLERQADGSRVIRRHLHHPTGEVAHALDGEEDATHA